MLGLAIQVTIYDLREKSLHAVLLSFAVGADPVQFHLVPRQRHAEIARHGILHALDRRVLEFDDPAASLTDEMIVMPLADRFVTRLALVEMPLVQQQAFLQQPHRPVIGRIADARIYFLDLAVKFLGADMMPVLEEYARDVVALAGGLEPALLEARMEGEHPLFRSDRRFAIDYGAASCRGSAFAFAGARHRRPQDGPSPRWTTRRAAGDRYSDSRSRERSASAITS